MTRLPATTDIIYKKDQGGNQLDVCETYYKKCVYISWRHVIMVDSINLISWVRPDLVHDRGKEASEVAADLLLGERH